VAASALALVVEIPVVVAREQLRERVEVYGGAWKMMWALEV
jgi:hypothetical protein